jgi:MYXO-CTERM domain-containing protein
MRALTTFSKILAAGALATLLAAAPARAEQIVLFDTTYTHTNANDSHHSISGAALNQPANWTAPIDYSQGTIHFYQEVMTKPSNKPTIIDFCLISTRDYGCIETFVYTTTGLHETVRSMAGKDVDKRNVIDFTHAMRSIQMVLKTPAPTYINGGSPQSDFLPSTMRFVATLVSPGGTYVRPIPTPGFDPGDGGAPAPSDAAAAAAPDATAPADSTAAEAEPLPPITADAAPTKPTTKPDAGSKPPTTPPTDDPAPTADPPARTKSGGCTVGSAGRPVSLLVALAGIALALLARRRRSD